MKTIEVIWAMTFIYLITIAVICYINDKKGNGLKSVRNYAIVLFLLSIVMIIVFRMLDRVNIIQITFEVICWLIIAFCIIKNRKLFKKVNLTNKEVIIFIIVVILGITFLAILGVSNFTYTYPRNEYGHIGNMYFNADVNRGLEDLITTRTLGIIHPGYRFVQLPIMGIGTILYNTAPNLGVSMYNVKFVLDYFVCLIQIIASGFSVIVFYRILKQESISEKISTLGTVLFGLSFAFFCIWLFPETYAITLLTLLLFIYSYRNNSKLAVALAIASISTNLMAVIPIGITILYEVLKGRKEIINIIKRMNKVFLVIIYALLVGIFVSVFGNIWEYLSTFKDGSFNILNSVYASFNYLLVTWFTAPKYINNFPYFVQTVTPSLFSLILFIPIIIIAIIGYLTRFKKGLLPNLCLIFLVIAYGLHEVFGYGKQNGVIYAPLYSWAFILLFIYGIEYVFKSKRERLAQFLIMLIITGITINNLYWFTNFRNDISKIEFYKDMKGTVINYDFSLTTENSTKIEFEKRDSILLLKRNGRIVLDGTDGTTYNKKFNTYTGFLKNGSWFKLYVDGNKLMLDISGDVKEVGDDEFYIFGMGLREKLIYANNKLIKYSTKEIILDNLELEKIEYGNYKLYAKDKDNKYVVYEDSNGIYLLKNGVKEILDESVEINIPDFSKYKNEKILKILFNEIMVNITKDGPKPNFIAYENAWYRDSAMVAMVLEKTRKFKAD